MIEQSIKTPFGINVFGSAVVRVDPDVASIKFRVSYIDKDPKEAFLNVHANSKQVRAYLAKTRIRELATARITIAEEYRYINNSTQKIGFEARVDSHLLLDELDSLEDIVNGLVAAGATNIQAVDFQTRKLKEFRAEARKRAVAAAREKAELYCGAAGVRLGTVRHIEDVNPEVVGRRNSGHNYDTGVDADDDGELRAFDPGSILVAAAVMISFGIE